MSKVTSKLQVTLPKALADQLGIKPGDQIDWEIAGEVLRVKLASRRRKEKKAKEDLRTRLRLFDQATERQRQRETKMDLLDTHQAARGWVREDLYRRGSAG